ncbi:hypothetical protein Pst134EA_017112 [Puccinia striiformis f. sp. tritici]|uniref:hypothetical protein n=1 Tax=Puccinia striiformis f. sp. tritici TaxID=168172 RepID=UPI002008DCA5|nr:hypothetical protein Pst134EA_017112 [Puccinia striiformis f. sp. tritici]KAH9460795.1 hypothetical protein Pst134EA_017112 [Puccinia striiformis f. sp. tritici]
MVDVSKPEWVEYVQKKLVASHQQIRGPMIYPAMSDVWGRIIISADGPAWKRTRQAMVSIFTPKTFKVDDPESNLILYSKMHYYTRFCWSDLSHLTAQSLSWAFFHLLMNKDLISKIREETIEVLGDDGVDDQQSVTYENYKQFL